MFETSKKIGNATHFFIQGEKTLEIVELGNGKFYVENRFTKMLGKVTILTPQIYSISLDMSKKKDKLGRWRNAKKDSQNDMASWFSYILQDKGYIQKQEVAK